MYFTPHAIERFRQRYAPGYTYSAALRELQTLALSAKPQKRKASGGKLYYLITNGQPILLVCHRNERGDRLAERDRLVCETVLPPSADPAQAEDEA